MRNLANIAWAIAAIALFCGQNARAASLTATEANIITSSLVIDQDLVLPAFMQPIAFGQMANFDGTLTASGWSGVLTGDYFGNPLNVKYSADASNFGQSGMITWEKAGSYGASAWTGSGTIMFTSMDLANITASFASTLTLGANSLSFVDSVAGSLDSSFSLTVTATGAATVYDSSRAPGRHLHPIHSRET